MKPLFSILIVALMILSVNGQTAGNQQNILSDKDSINSVPTGFGSLPKQSTTGAISHIDHKNFNESICKNSPLQLVQNKLTGLMMSLPNSSDPTNMEVEFSIRGINSFNAGIEMLYFIDGVPGDINSIAPLDIKSFTLLRDLSSTNIFGSLSNGPVILIETKKANSNRLTVNYSTQLSVEKFAKYAVVFSADEYRQNINRWTHDYSYNTDWFDEIMQNNFSQQHFVSANGGTQHVKAYGSVAYRDMEGVVKKSGNQEIKSFLSFDINAFDNRININLTGRLNHSKQNPADYEIFKQALQNNPTQRPYDDDGNYTSDPVGIHYYNPLNLLNESKYENRINNNLLKGSFGLKITDDWSLHANTSLNNFDIKYSEDYTGLYEYPKNYSFGTLSYLRQTQKEEFFYFDGYTNYRKTFARHFFNVTAGFVYNADKYNDISTYYLVTDTSHILSSGDSLKSYSFFGKVNYGYADKYFINLSLACSKNPLAVKKYLNYPSVSVGWALSREHFMERFDFIDEVKIRAGYGIKYEIYTAYTDYYPKSDDLNDQKISEINIGADWTLFQNRLNGSFDFYKRKTSDLILVMDWNLNNVGDIENKGIEIGVQTIPLQFKNFSWILYANYSTNINKLLLNETYKNYSIDYGYTPHPIGLQSHRISDGQPSGNFYGFKSTDIDENGGWIIETPTGEHLSIHGLSFDERQVIGNGIPKHFLGIANAFKYKKFDFSINLRGAFCFQVMNCQRMLYENPDAYTNRLASSDELVYGKTTLNNPEAYVSYYIEDGGYLKIDNLTLGYTTRFKKAISSIRVYLSAQNVHTLSKYKGIDPELSINPRSPGMERTDVYPYSKTFIIGINITLNN
jgi:TonB-linked SusC/RagA family outer membrane protein